MPIIRVVWVRELSGGCREAGYGGFHGQGRDGTEGGGVKKPCDRINGCDGYSDEGRENIEIR